MTQYISKNMLLSCLMLLAPAFLFAQEAVPAAPAQAGGGFDFNLLLLVVAVFLLLPVYVTGKAFMMVITNYAGKEKSGNDVLKKGGTLMLLLFSFQLMQAQAATAATMPNTFSWLLLTVILVESLVIIFFSWLINNLLKTYNAPAETSEATVAKESNWFGNIWNRLNRFKPIEEEGAIDTGHSYDGIRELDNITPPWFITGFGLTIVFAIIYLYRYHVAKSAPLPAEEYRIEMEEAEAEKLRIQSTQKNSVDENTITMLDAAEISQGKMLFTKNCSSCHGATGGSMTGGVGPNLTDDYWIHGGSLSSIFLSIKNGWPEKGMISWKNQLSPKQMAQLTCYVKSVQGSNPEGAKGPQGDLYTEVVTAKADSTAKDTTLKQAPKPAK